MSLRLRFLQCVNVKLKPVVLSCAYGFRNNYMLNSVYFSSLVDLENKSCLRVPLVITLPECELNQLSRRSKNALQMVCEQFRFTCVIGKGLFSCTK